MTAAEMAIAGGWGVRLYLAEAPHEITADEAAQIPGGLANALLFAESNSRFLVEVPPNSVGHFEETMGDVPHNAIGEVLASTQFIVADVDPMAEKHLIEVDIAELKAAWQKPLDW